MDSHSARAAMALGLLFALPAFPSNADQLLVIKPVTNEILGHLGIGQDNKAAFIDCNNKEYDPKSGRIKPTQDTCDPAGGTFSAASFHPIGDYLQGPVFDAQGTQLGTIDSLAITSDGTNVDVLLDNGKSVSLAVKQAANWSGLGNDQNRLVLDSMGMLDWTKQ
jgi:hypothetical protein